MNKIAILSAVNIKHMSLISLYTDYFKKHNIPYDIIYMDKYDEEEKFDADHIYRFVNVIDHNWSRRKKVIRYFRFFGYAKRILKREKYDFIVIWNDVAISMFGLYLARAWKGKYCLNIRDYNKENKWYIYKLFERAINSSAFCTISSEGFKSFLPKHDYISLYSFNASLMRSSTPKSEKRKIGDRIRISFIGNVRFFDVNEQLVKVFRNDPRFELHFHGTNAEHMESYAKCIGADNVICSGAFPVSQTNEFLEETDIINNAFGSKTVGVRTLTSIRLFYGAYMKIPILVTSGTYMDELIQKFGIGFSLGKIDETLPDALYQWYHAYDQRLFELGCEELLDEAEEANQKFCETLGNVCEIEAKNI